MTLFYLPIPLSFERLKELHRLVEAPDFNIDIAIDGLSGNAQPVIDSLREVIVQAIIACDGAVNGSRN